MVMKNGVLAIMAIILLAGCKQKHESLEDDADSLLIVADSIDMQRKLVFQDCNAIVVGEGVRLRSAPDTKAEVVEKLNTGRLLKIIKPGDKRVVLGTPDHCNPDGYFWYEVIEAGGNRGWIYGEFIYHLMIRGRNDAELDPVQRRLFAATFGFNDEDYNFGYARSGVRSVQYEDGSPFCVSYLMPFLYRSNTGNVYPLKFTANRKNTLHMPDITKEKGYFRFAVGGALDDQLIAYRMEKDVLQLTLGRDIGEDEQFIYTLNLRPSSGVFTATPADPGNEFLPR